MDSTLARSLFAKSCKGCERFVTNFFDDEKRLHRHYVGSRVGVTGADNVRNDHRQRANQVVDVTATQRKGVLVNASGSAVAHEPAVPHIAFRGWLIWRGQSWAIVDWKRVIFK
jgi:ABC-type sulfate transport system substrate-binding protein